MATIGLHSVTQSKLPALQDMWCSFNEITFTCAMCNNSVEEATFLSCLHSFCLKCIQNGKEDELNEFNCPCCRAKHSYLFLEIKNNLPSLFRRLQSLSKTDNDDVICESCVNRAEPLPGVAYCLECSAVICEVELECHRKYGLKHRIINLKDLKDWTGSDILTRLRQYKTDETAQLAQCNNINKFIGTCNNSESSLHPMIRLAKKSLSAGQDSTNVPNVIVIESCNTAQLLLHESNDNVGDDDDNDNDDDDGCGGSDSDDEDDCDNNVTSNVYATTATINDNNTNSNDDDDGSDDGARGCNNTIVYDVSGSNPSTESVYSLGESCLCGMMKRVQKLEGKKRAIEEEWSDELIKLNGVFDDMKQLLEQRRLECVAEVETLYQELLDPFCNQMDSLRNDIQLMEYYTALSAYSYISDVTSGVCSKMIKLTNSFACLAPLVKAFKPILEFEDSILSLQSSIENFLEDDFNKEDPDKFTPISFMKDAFLKYEIDSSLFISPILSVDYDSSTGLVYSLHADGWKAFHCFDDGRLVIVECIHLDLDIFRLGDFCSLLVLPDYVVISGIASKNCTIKVNCIYVFTKTGSLIHYFPSFHKIPKLYKISNCKKKDRFLSIEHNVGICHVSIKGDVKGRKSLHNLIDISVDVDGEHIYVLLSPDVNDNVRLKYTLHYYNINTLKRVRSFCTAESFKSIRIPSFCLIFPISPKIVMLYEVDTESAIIYELSVLTSVKAACLQPSTRVKTKLSECYLNDDDMITPFVTNHKSYVIYHDSSLYFIN